MKAHNKHCVCVFDCNNIIVVCPLIEFHWSFKVSCLNFFFQNLSFKIGGAAYLWVRLINGLLITVKQVNEAYYSFNLILGERKSPYVAICCIAMAASILFW